MNNSSFPCRVFMVGVVFLLVAGGLARGESAAADEWHSSVTEREELAKKFGLANTGFHFPGESFLEGGYAPPDGYVKDFSVIRDGPRWHVFHIDGRPTEKCWESGNEISFGHASTDDFRHWVRHNMPLAIGDRAWENAHVWAPYVTKWREKFYMFYMAAGVGHSGVLTYATSNDLERWEKWGRAIEAAQGRDPFVRIEGETIYLYYTATAGGVRVVKSTDMENWSESEVVIRDPKKAAAESSSVQPLGKGYVIWYNDYLHTRDASGDFRAVYAMSEDPLKFDTKDLKSFEFHTTRAAPYAASDWVEKRPIPIGIELVEKGEKVWLVAYFRWDTDRFRLFFGRLDWGKSPARIEEIVERGELGKVLGEVGKSGG